MNNDNKEDHRVSPPWFEEETTKLLDLIDLYLPITTADYTKTLAIYNEWAQKNRLPERSYSAMMCKLRAIRHNRDDLVLFQRMALIDKKLDEKDPQRRDRMARMAKAKNKRRSTKDGVDAASSSPSPSSSSAPAPAADAAESVAPADTTSSSSAAAVTTTSPPSPPIAAGAPAAVAAAPSSIALVVPARSGPPPLKVQKLGRKTPIILDSGFFRPMKRHGGELPPPITAEMLQSSSSFAVSAPAAAPAPNPGSAPHLHNYVESPSGRFLFCSGCGSYLQLPPK